MNKINNVIFGDNQFFGINHMSQEKAQQLSERFFDIEKIFEVYEYALESGIDSIMLNSNDRAKFICNYFRENPNKYGHINWYPSIPYPHKYANMVAEKGIVGTLNEILFTNTSAKGILQTFTKGGLSVMNKDIFKLMEILVDTEMKIYRKLNVKAIFIQNIITDLILGLRVKDAFISYANYIEKKYNTLPGFITQNLPELLQYLKEIGIKQAVICTSVNQIGYLMSPSKEAYEEVLKYNDSERFPIIAMSVFASGAIKPEKAIAYIKKQNIQSIVFGASSKNHIMHTKELIN